jgi:flagellar basal body-associated protein FliL
MAEEAKKAQSTEPPAAAAAPAAPAAPATPAASAAPAKAGGSKNTIIITAGVAVVFMVGGFFVARMLVAGPASAKAETAATEAPVAKTEKAAEKKPAEKKGGEKKGKGKEGAVTVSSSPDSPWLYELEPVVANLDEPGVTRYVRASFILEVSPALPDAKGSALFDEHKAFLRNWLNLYLAGCTLDDIRGRKNLARIQAEIKDAFNDVLFKNSKPMINRVLFKEFQIQ